MSGTFGGLLAVLAIPALFIALVGPHEFGHYLAARLCRVRVHEFAIGMGPKLASFTRGEILYALRALPIGGYVRLGGMEPDTFDDPRGFHTRPAWQRFTVLIAGPVANFLFAAVFVAPIFFVQAADNLPGRIIEINVGSPADQAGLRPGDRIVSVNGRPVHEPSDIRTEVDRQPGAPLTVVVDKAGGGRQTVTLAPQYDARASRYLIGVGAEGTYTAGDALRRTVSFPYLTAVGIFSGMYDLATGRVPGGFVGPEGATGAIGIGYLTYQAASQGWMEYLYVLAVLSMALGLANLLPLPALDGGRILVVALEKLRGRAFDRDREMQVQRYGLVALLALIAFIAYFDVQRIATHQFPALH